MASWESSWAGSAHAMFDRLLSGGVRQSSTDPCGLPSTRPMSCGAACWPGRCPMTDERLPPGSAWPRVVTANAKRLDALAAANYPTPPSTRRAVTRCPPAPQLGARTIVTGLSSSRSSLSGDIWSRRSGIAGSRPVGQRREPYLHVNHRTCLSPRCRSGKAVKSCLIAE